MSDETTVVDGPSPCLNCGSTLQGKYCCQCGQKAHVHRSLSAIGHDLAHGVLHIDGKIWNTLPLLLLKPGELTRRYIAGERAKFLSPMGLNLFSVFLLFAVMALAPSQEPLIKTEPTVETAVPADQKPLEAEGKKPAAVKINDNINIGFGDKDLDTQIKKKLDYIFENKDLITYKIKANGYKLAWLLIPLSLPFMWLVLIGRRGFHLYDHAVFVTYSISFMGLLVSVAAVLGIIPFLGWLEGMMLVLVPPLHLYSHLKNSYGLGRIEAATRLILLLWSIFCVTLMYGLMLVLLGIF